jgi:hypothetical protein
VLFADDTSVIITASNLNDLQTKAEHTLTQMNEWFAANGLTCKLDKTNELHFKSIYLQSSAIQISYHGKTVKKIADTKFLGLGLDNHMKWKTHIDLILPKLSRACYVIRFMYFLRDISTLKVIYYAYFHAIMEYGIIFWGNSSLSKKIFQLQKKIIRTMTGSTSRASCKPLFKTLGILTMLSQYILSLMTFLANTLEYFTFQSSIHGKNTRGRVQIQKPIANLTSYQRDVYYASITAFNALPVYIVSQVTNRKYFINKLKAFLLDKTLYTNEEYFTYVHEMRAEDVV